MSDLPPHSPTPLPPGYYQPVETSDDRLVRRVTIVAFAVIALVLVGYQLAPTRRGTVSPQVQIPAGMHRTGSTQQEYLPEFWIDAHEVTEEQYRQFLEWLEQNPGQERLFDHPNQPADYRHWEPVDPSVYAISIDARFKLRVRPVRWVSWWDAFAYAKWLGRELPTAGEWERAAQGPTSYLYVWGNTADEARANMGADWQNNPLKKGSPGSVDGHNEVHAIDEMAADASQEGVKGMQGNLSEWTNSWDQGMPVVKGGNYTIPLLPLTGAIPGHVAERREGYLGFRTITHSRP